MGDEETGKNEMKGKNLGHPKGSILLAKLCLVSSLGELPLEGGQAFPPSFLPHPQAETCPVAFRHLAWVPLIKRSPGMLHQEYSRSHSSRLHWAPLGSNFQVFLEKWWTSLWSQLLAYEDRPPSWRKENL